MALRNLFPSRKASLWRRLSAYAIDLLAIAVILSPLRKLEIPRDSFSALMQFLTNNPDAAGNLFLTTLIAAVVTILYFSILEFKLKQTLGKLIMNLEVKSLTKELTFPQTILRSIAKISTVLLLIDYLYGVFTHSNQRFSDTISNTEVIEKWAR